MKKLVYLLLIIPILISCSNDDNEHIQDYTSFTVTINSSSIFKDCIAGYKLDGKFKKIANLGELTEGKTSAEVQISDNNITEIYIFADLGGATGIVRADAVYTLTKYKKNTIVVSNNTRGIQITDKTDPTQYPQ